MATFHFWPPNWWVQAERLLAPTGPLKPRNAQTREHRRDILKM